jgi:hypothetical protein
MRMTKNKKIVLMPKAKGGKSGNWKSFRSDRTQR